MSYIGNAAISNNLDVSGISSLSFVSSGTINGLSGGVTGQIIYIYGANPTATVTLANNNAGGTQKFLCPGNTNMTISGGYGGCVLFFSGGFWFIIART
jgi:hypothetical protein